MTDVSSDAAHDQGVLAAPLVLTDPAASGRETWRGTPVPAGYTGMVEQLRELLDRVARAAPSAEVITRTTTTVAELNAVLAEYEVDETDRPAGGLLTVPGRGQLTAPVLHVEELDDDHMVGRTRFGAHFLGSNGAVHGGAIPLLFDDLLGRFAITSGRSRSRTAFMHVDYRSVTPIETDLRVEAHFDREEGRKRHLRGTIHDGDRLCAEATALFVALRPGQP